MGRLPTGRSTYGAYPPDGVYMYGKKVRGIERSTFLIGPDGKLVREWRKLKVEGHAEEVLAAVKAL